MARNYAEEYRRRNQRAQEQGFTSYAQRRRIANLPRYGGAGFSQPGTRVRGRRRVHDAVGVGEDVYEDWELTAFASSRVDRARYSPSRRELQVMWVNAPGGVPYPPYIYDAVDQAVWSSFQTSGSPGRFVNNTLNQYPYRPEPGLRGLF